MVTLRTALISVRPPSCPALLFPIVLITLHRPTRLELDFADLAIIDLSKAITPEGRAELASQLRHGLCTNGFLYVINHGYTQAQRDRIFDIADVLFAAVPPEEMKIFTADPEKVGYYTGCKQVLGKKSTRRTASWIRSNTALHRDVTKRPHPEALRSFLPELDGFAGHNHFNILHPILRLIALSLELPGETLVDKHTFDGQGETAIRFMKYYRRTEEEEEKSKNVWLKGHTDIGSVTILWSQPVGGLQILSPDGKWRWVQHINNALVINTGDMMDFLTGGFYKPTIHRVVQPPHDQRAYDRLGVFYFTMADNDVKLLPLAHSPVLQRVGIERRCPDEEAPLAEAWRKERTMSYGRVALKQGSEKNTEVETIEGIVVKHYN